LCHNFRVESGEGRGYHSVTLPLSSSYEVVTRQRAESFSFEAAHLLHDDEPFDLRSNDAMVLVVNFKTAHLRNVASKLQLLPAEHRNRVELTTPSGRAWQR
jgi:hypothetical protein